MQDTKTLAQTLGLSEKTIRTRAAALGLVPEQVSQGAGRPKALWSAEQAAAIAAYGQTQDSPETDIAGDEAQSAALAYATAQSALAMPMNQQFAKVGQQLENLEDQAAIALAQRVSQVPHRALAKACHLLQEHQKQGGNFDIADILGGALGLAPMQPKPIQQSLTTAQLKVYADNF